jgi:hypothetical protein
MKYSMFSFILMMQSASMWLYKGHKLVVMGRINFEDHAFIKR